MVGAVGPNPLSTGTANFGALRAELLAAAALLTEEQSNTRQLDPAVARQLNSLLTPRVDAAQLLTVAALLGISLPDQTFAALTQSNATALPYTPLTNPTAAVADVLPLNDDQLDQLVSDTRTPSGQANTNFVSKLVRPSVFAEQIVGAPLMLGTTTVSRESLLTRGQNSPLVFALGNQQQPLHLVVLNNNLSTLSSLKPKAFGDALAMMLRQAIIDAFGANPPVDVRVNATKDGQVHVSYLSLPQSPSVGAPVADNLGFALLAQPNSKASEGIQLLKPNPRNDGVATGTTNPPDNQGDTFTPTRTRIEPTAFGDAKSPALALRVGDGFNQLAAQTPATVQPDQTIKEAWRDVFAILRNTPTMQAQPTAPDVVVTVQTASNNSVNHDGTPGNSATAPTSTTVTVTSQVTIHHNAGTTSTTTSTTMPTSESTTSITTGSTSPGSAYLPSAWYAGWWNTAVQSNWSATDGATKLNVLVRRILVTILGVAIGAMIISIGLATDPAIALVVVGAFVGAIAATAAYQLWSSHSARHGRVKSLNEMADDSAGEPSNQQP